MYVRIAIIALIVALVSALPTQLNYKVGQQFVYRLDTTVNTGALDVQKVEPVTGRTFADLKSTVVTKVTEIRNGNYIFVMNMFNTEYTANQAATETSASNDALGYDMYFEQKPNGEISTVWAHKKDSAYYINVKLGAINALQTRIVTPGKVEVFHESDPIGIHSSVFTATQTVSRFSEQTTGENAVALAVTKRFNAEDVSRFSTDAAVSANNVDLTYTSSVIVNNQGFIESATAEQAVLLTDVERKAAAKKLTAIVGSEEQDPFNAAMRATSVLNVGLVSVTMDSTFGALKTTAQLDDDSSDYASSSLFASAAKASTEVLNDDIPNVDVPETIKAVLSASQTDEKLYKNIYKLVRYFKAQPDSMVSVLHNALESALSSPTNAAQKAARVYFILSALSPNAAAEKLIIEFGLQLSSVNPEMREAKMQAIFTTQSISNPSNAITAALQKIAGSQAEDAEVQSAALLAFGSVLSKLAATDASATAQGAVFLIDTLIKGINADNQQSIALTLRAIANCGPEVVPLSKIPSELLHIVSQKPVQQPKFNGNVRRAVAHLLQVYSEILAKQPQLDASLADSNFPYNVSWNKGVSLGGKMASIDADATLFAGTNFDCNQDYFNYEGLARANGSFSFMGQSSSLFLAEAVYGKENGQTLANQILLTVLDKTIYDRQLPSLDCSVHTYNLYHATPAWSYSYTVWVSIVPIVFRASASLVLNVDWSWNVCDASLSAMVRITPSAGVKLAGDAEINLLYLKAGVELAASVNSAIQPQVYVKGSQCTVGFDVTLITNPMTAYFESYYEFKKCKFLFFDCKWGKHNEKVWWSWTLPASSKVLFTKEYKIAKSDN